MVKVREIIEAVQQQQAAAVPPAVVQQQAKVNNVIAQIAAHDRSRPPNEAEIALAHDQYAEMKRKSDEKYAKLMHQRAMQAIQSKGPRVGGRLKR